MKITLSKEQEKMYASFSEKNLKFFRHVEENPNYADLCNYQTLEFKHLKTSMCPWPIFISKNMKQKFSDAALSMTKVLQRVPFELMNGDKSMISSFFNYPEDKSESSLNSTSPKALKNIILRGDYLYTRSGLKCVELNLGPGLGGWQTSFINEMMLNENLINAYIKKENIEPLKNDVIYKFLDHIVECLVKGKIGESFNIAFVSKGKTLAGMDGVFDYINSLYKKVLAKNGLPLAEGKVYSLKYNELLAGDKGVFFKEKRISAILDVTYQVPGNITDLVSKNKLLVFDGNIFFIIGSKLVLAFLSEGADNKKFPDDINTIVDKYVPWTRKLENKETTFNGTRENIISLAHRLKDHMVLKTPLENSGKGVFVGSFKSNKQWLTICQKALVEGNWLIQEKLESVPLVNINQDSTIDEFNSVWGLFSFGSKYAGSYLRLSPNRFGRGVVNGAQGAAVSALIEI